MRYKNKLYSLSNGVETYELTKAEILEKLNLDTKRFDVIVSLGKTRKGWLIKQIPDKCVAYKNGEVCYEAKNWDELGSKMGYSPQYIASACRSNSSIAGYTFEYVQIREDK